MRGNAITATLLGLLLAASSGTALASGYGINEHGAKAMGMAGAYTAIADVPSTTFFNPAGLATLPGLQLEAGMTFIAPTGRFRGPVPGTDLDATVDATNNYFFIPNFHASYRIHDRVAVGLGAQVPYGLTMEWPNTVTVDGQQVAWWGRGIIERIALQTYYFTPQVAVNIHPRVQVGGGLYVVGANVELRRAVTVSANTADDILVNLGADDVGFSGTAGLLVTIVPELLKAGFTFRGGPSFTFEGNAAFTKNGTPDDIPAGLRTRLTDGPAQAELNIPHVFSFGLAAFPIKPLTIGFNFDVITWSRYDQLAITFQDTPEAPTRSQDLSTVEPKNWSTAVAVRIGAEYKVLPQLGVRAGFIYDQSGAPASTVGPELPDADRYEFTLGGGYEWRGLKVDLAYQYLTSGNFRTPEVSPLGAATWKADAHLLGISLGYGLSL